MVQDWGEVDQEELADEHLAALQQQLDQLALMMDRAKQNNAMVRVCVCARVCGRGHAELGGCVEGLSWPHEGAKAPHGQRRAPLLSICLPGPATRPACPHTIQPVNPAACALVIQG